MSLRGLKILGSGIYLPKRAVSSSEVDKLIGAEEGSVSSTTKIESRYYADLEKEPVSKMGAWALHSALEKSKLNIDDVDLIISASGTGFQEIPYTASMIMHEYENEYSCIIENVASFDVNATCMSFMQAIDLTSSLFVSARYKRIAIISAENASNGLDYKEIEVSGLFGDGAAAYIIEADESEGDKQSGVVAARFKTYAKAAHVCEIAGGGSRIHPRHYIGNEKMFYFQMNGKRVFRLALKTLPNFVEQFFKDQQLDIVEDIDYVVPHQASHSALELMRKKFKVDSSKWANIISDHGNMISVSIPLALHYAIENKFVEKGSLVFLVGTSAGYSVGGLLLRL